MKEPVESLGEAAWDALQRIVRELLARKPGSHLVESELAALDLRLPLATCGPDADPRRFSRRLVRSIDRMLDDAIQQAAAFRPGHTYCHRCQSPACEHSAPPSCRHVVAGYAPTGLPRWIDFAQLCLDRRHPEVDRLYDDPPALLTLVQDPERLHGGILPAFADGNSELLGQVSAGFFRVPARADEGRGVLALTVQATASRSRRAPTRYGVNLLGRSPSGEPLDSLWERQDELPWRRAVQWAQQALQDVTASARRRGTARRAETARVEGRVDGIMRGLARRLEHDQRARSRRTRHAEHRHVSGERPTRKALDDLREAPAESFLIDERRGTVVVLGDRGRTHIYTPGGRHVSSVRYTRDSIARKIRLAHWRVARPDEVEALRAVLFDGD